MMSGRAEARAPQADVRIGLETRGAESDPRRASIRPARARVEPLLDSDSEDDERSPGIGNRNVTPEEDLEPPAEEAAAIAPRTDRSPVARLEARPSAAPIRAGWSVRQRSSSVAAREPTGPRAQVSGDDSPRRLSSPDGPAGKSTTTGRIRSRQRSSQRRPSPRSQPAARSFLLSA